MIKRFRKRYSRVVCPNEAAIEIYPGLRIFGLHCALVSRVRFAVLTALYIKEQERDADFVPIGSERDEKIIDKMNKKAAGMDEEEVPTEPKSTKVEVKQENIVLMQEEDIDLQVWQRLDFIELHSLVMQRFSITTPKGIDLVLWGDLRNMFEETADDDIWKNQEKWIIKSWTFYKNYGVHILAFRVGTYRISHACRMKVSLIRETFERMCAHVISNEALAIPEQSATAKEYQIRLWLSSLLTKEYISAT
ncbi:hypothetical protein Tco_1083642 [Tanacetum coccineum]